MTVCSTDLNFDVIVFQFHYPNIRSCTNSTPDIRAAG